MIELTKIAEEVTEAKRLGRHVEHDVRSWLFPAPMAAKPASVQHALYGPVLDQGDLGSCTGNAAVGLLNTEPFCRGQSYDESFAVLLYGEATALDGFTGTYPPEDTGSSGLAVSKAMKRRGLVGSYHHAFGFKNALRAITLRPALIGMAWRSGCDSPDADGLVRYVGDVRGGHEILADGLDLEDPNPDKHLVWFLNSWGSSFGKNGRFCMTVADFGLVLDNQGDVTVPVPIR